MEKSKNSFTKLSDLELAIEARKIIDDPRNKHSKICHCNLCLWVDEWKRTLDERVDR